MTVRTLEYKPVGKSAASKMKAHPAYKARDMALVAFIEKGHSFTDAGHAFGISRERARQVANKYGVEFVPKRIPYGPEILETVKDFVSKGHSLCASIEMSGGETKDAPSYRKHFDKEVLENNRRSLDYTAIRDFATEKVTQDKWTTTQVREFLSSTGVRPMPDATFKKALGVNLKTALGKLGQKNRKTANWRKKAAKC